MPRVSISGTNKSYEVAENGILYDSLLDQGEELPHGCLSGSCGVCKIEVLDGQENLAPAGVIEANTVASIIADNGNLEGKNVRLSCRAKVIGNVVFRPIK